MKLFQIGRWDDKINFKCRDIALLAPIYLFVEIVNCEAFIRACSGFSINFQFVSWLIENPNTDENVICDSNGSVRKIDKLFALIACEFFELQNL